MLSYKPQGGDFRPLGAVEWVNSLDGKRHQIELTNEKNEEDFTVCFFIDDKKILYLINFCWFFNFKLFNSSVEW